MGKLLITRRLPAAVEARAQRDHKTVFNPADRVWPMDDLLVEAGRFEPDAVLVSPSDAVASNLIEGLPTSVKVIATFSVGYDHIDLRAAVARGITITNTPGVLTEATADVALLCLLGAARKAHEAQTCLRQGRWDSWAPAQFLGAELSGAVLGIVGMGRIGRATARRAAGFGMRIRYWTRRPVDQAVLSGEGLSSAAAIADLDTLLAMSDIVSLHVPLTDETHHIIDHRAINRMRKGAILVNTARGGLIDDQAVLVALATGQIGAVGLDVFDGEPALHQGYLSAPNAYLLPHIGSATVSTRNAMGFIALDNIDAVLAGDAPPNPVS